MLLFSILIFACNEPKPPMGRAPAAAVKAKAEPATPKKEKKPLSQETQALLATVTSQEKQLKERKAALEKLAVVEEPEVVIPLAALADGNEGTAILAEELRAALQKLDATTFLVTKLRSADEEDRTLAAELLQNVPSPKAYDALLIGLDDPSAKVREHCAAALMALKDRRSIPALGKRLEVDKSKDVRSAAAQALGQLGGPEAVKILLVRQSTEKDSFVKIFIEEGIEEAKAIEAKRPK